MAWCAPSTVLEVFLNACSHMSAEYVVPALLQQPAPGLQQPVQPHRAAQCKPGRICVRHTSASGLCTCSVGRLTPKDSSGVAKRGLALASPGEQECCAGQERQGRPPCNLERSDRWHAMLVQSHTYGKLSYGAKSEGTSSMPVNRHFPADSGRHGWGSAEP